MGSIGRQKNEPGRRIVGYHAVIRVRRGGQVWEILVDLDDFYEDVEVLGKLAAACPGVRTVGDLVLAVQSGSWSVVGSGIVSCRISGGGDVAKPSTGPVRDWGDLL